MLTQGQKREFVEQGYLKIPGVVPQVMIEAARRKVYHSIGNVGMGGETWRRAGADTSVRS